MKSLYLRLIARMASVTNLAVLSMLWLLTEFLVRPGAELEISKWSLGQEALNLPLLINPQSVLEQIALYGDDGRRFYSFVVLTVETVSTLLSFLCLSFLLYLLSRPIQHPWKKQWWKVTMLMFSFDVMTNGLLLQLLSGSTKLDIFLAWCYVIANGSGYITHCLTWFFAVTLLFLQARQFPERFWKSPF